MTGGQQQLPSQHYMDGSCKKQRCFKISLSAWNVLRYCLHLVVSMLCSYGQAIKVNWAYASGQREDTSGCYSFVLCYFPYLFVFHFSKISWFFFCPLLTMPLLLSQCSSGHFNIFVGDLGPEVTDASLFAAFSVFPSCS